MWLQVNQTSTTKSSQEMIIRTRDLLLITAEGIQFMLYTAVSAASPQKCSGRDQEINKAGTISNMSMFLLSSTVLL